MIKRFVLYAIARTGSNYLISQLNNHPLILCHYELFHKENIFYGFSDKQISFDTLKDNWNLDSRDKNPLRFIDSVFEIHQDDEQAIGYNIFPNQNDFILKNSLMDLKQKKIVLKRKDILKTFVSRGIAAKTNVWAYGDADALPEKEAAKTSFHRDELLSYLLRSFNYYNYIETILGITRQDYLTVYYEDVLKERDDTFNRIFRFLNVREQIINDKSQFIKQNTDNLELLVENHNKMNKFVLNYDFKAFFDSSNKVHDYFYTIKKRLIKLLGQK
jgi:LPS sulfotransferase NodH